MNTTKMKHWIFFIVIAAALIQCKDKSEALFTSIPSSTSGINFSNIIPISDSTSVLDSEYLYNGGGVAVGDVNNDGLLVCTSRVTWSLAVCTSIKAISNSKM